MVTVTNIKQNITDLGIELCGLVHSDDQRLNNQQLWFRYPVEYSDGISTSNNAFIPALLMPAMCSTQKLHVEGRISKKMLHGAQRFMEITHKWWPEYKPVEIEADEYDETNQTNEYVGMFFSGGLDSFYTMLKNHNCKIPDSERISHLILVHGFDVKLQDGKLFDMALDGVNAAAKAYGKQVIRVATNVREVVRQTIDWARYFGSAMISVALGLDGVFRKVYIPSTYAYDQLFPHGSHPLIDPLWSTEKLEIIHDGCEAGRVEKILQQVGKSQVAMDNLRVCWENHDGKYNCGRCEKCVRTMITLKAAGLLESCKSFEGGLSYSKVRNLRLNEHRFKLFAQENLRALIAGGADRRLIKVLKRSLSPWHVRDLKKLFRKLIKSLRF